MSRRYVALLPLMICGLLASAPRPVEAQGTVASAAIGAVAGAGSGGYIALTVIVAESRAGKYLHSYTDALGWRSAPVLIGAATGGVLGFTNPEHLWRTVAYGTVGTVAGVGIGVVVGKIVWDGPEAKWAGGAIGSGIGMAIGSCLGVFLPLNHDNKTGAAQTALRVPITYTIRF